MVARKRRNTQSCKSNTKTSGKFNNYINKQETNCSNIYVDEYKNVCEIEKKNIRGWIDRNELILENLTCVEC